MERKFGDEDFELMSTLTKETKLANAVIAVGDRAWRMGYAEGHRNGGVAKSSEGWAMGFLLGMIAGAGVSAVIQIFV